MVRASTDLWPTRGPQQDTVTKLLQKAAAYSRGHTTRMKTRVFAVYDGHDGRDAVTYVAQHLHINIARSTYYPASLAEAIRDAFRVRLGRLERAVVHLTTQPDAMTLACLLVYLFAAGH